MPLSCTISPVEEMGRLELMHLKRYWSKMLFKADRTLPQNAYAEEWNLDNILFSVIGVGIYQVSKYLYEYKPSFVQFEDWILELNGGALNPDKVRLFNNLILEGKADEQMAGDEYKLSSTDREFWEKNGYLIVENAVSEEDCKAAVSVICDFLGISLSDSSTWYNSHEALQGIMVQLFQHPVLQKNRESPKVKAVYEQLWGKTQLWLNTDKVGFNPPETDIHKYKGIGMHWDVSLERPIPFGLQGILYLTDTAANQGAFSCVPGFHNKIEDWLESLPVDVNPRDQDLQVFNPVPIAARAGDFIIWHQALPHGASPNRHTSPRFVQYVNYIPVDLDSHRVWK